MAELIKVLVLHVPILSHDNPVFRPISVGSKLDRPDDRVDRVVVQPLSELRLVKRADRLDGLLDELAAGVEEWRQEVAEGVDSLALGDRPIALEEFVDAGKVHRWCDNITIIVGDAVERRAEAFQLLGVLNSDYGAAKHLDTVGDTYFGNAMDHSRRLDWVGGNEDKIRRRCIDVAQDSGKVDRIRRVMLVRYHLHAVFPGNRDANVGGVG